MNKIDFKKFMPYFAAIAIFIALATAYCWPAVEGKVLSQTDIISGQCNSHEVSEYAKTTGQTSYWTNSLFGGMPTYQISFPTTSSKIISVLRKAYTLFLGSVWAWFLTYLFGFFILMRAFNVSKWLSIIGAIAITLSTYFLIIIAAGHIFKVFAVGYMACVIAGFVYIFKKRYLLGASLTMVFTAFGMILHPQMAYYYMMMLGVFSVAELYIHLKENRLKDLAIGVGIFAASICIGLGTGYSNIKTNAEYVEETMRGGHSELTKSEGKAQKGLDFDYATSWSYGIGETMTLLVPDFYGGSSHYEVGTKSKLYDEMVKQGVPRSNAKQFCQSLPMYWGDMPFTEGPVYVGAIVCFLFLLGLIIVKSPYKWALLGATVFSILLAWGRNFEWLSRLFFNYFPMYNKFRAVSSILVVAEVAMPILGFMALQQIIDKRIGKQELKRALFMSGGVTGGICLLLALFGGSMFSFTSVNDEQIFRQLPDWINKLIISERATMLTSDAFRSLIFIAAAFVTLWLFVAEKIKVKPMLIAIGCLVLIDLWPVNKRYFNNDNFVNEKDKKGYFAKTDYEDRILRDTDPNFRVLNLTTNTFNDARTSYYLKSVGGYHAAKLRRYQDLIDEHISRGNMTVLNMLNTKYIIQQTEQGATPMLNAEAWGNCWFADSLIVAQTPREECDALNSIKSAATIVTDAKFSNLVQDFNSVSDSAASIRLTSYAPDALEYTSNSSQAKTAVFSEIYYPLGWKAYIDGNPTEIFRANYVLRALSIPAGEHKIRFEFRPDTVYKGDKVGVVCLILILMFVAGSIGWGVRNYLKAE